MDFNAQPMTRAERRRQQRAEQDKTVYHLTHAQLQEIKKQVADGYEKHERQVVNEAANTAFKLLLSIPIMTLHDHKDEILNGTGGTLEERFVQRMTETYICYEKGLVSLAELEECLRSETGIRFTEGEKNE